VIGLTMLVLAVLMVAGVPVSIALLGASVVYFVMEAGPNGIMAQRVVSGIQPFPLLAIPFFVLAGVAMANGGIAHRILGVADAFVGHLRGGLAQVNVFNSVVMGGMTGSGNADAALDSRILVPVMTKLGYDKGFSAALTASTGVIAPLIPPGIGLVIYAFLAEVSVGRMFLAGIVPALLLALAMGVVVNRISVRRGYRSSHDKRLPLRVVGGRIRGAAFALLMPVFLLMGLRAGVFTPTELGAFAAVYCLCVGVLIYREIPVRALPAIFRESIEATASIMLIIASSAAFGYIVTVERLPQHAIDVLGSVTSDPLLSLLIINVLLLALGTVIDGSALLVIVTPLLAPLAATLGIDPIHFGIIIVMNLTIGAVSPPIGTIMNTVCSITRTSLGEFSREVTPFLVAMIVVLLLVTLVPPISTALPDAVFGS
jgi:tripartite ATP-independent transporter DctM subunit